MRTSWLQALLVMACSLLIFGETGEAAPKESKLWDEWFTIRVLPNKRYGYYHEKVTRIDDKIRYQEESWKSEEGFINEEQIGAFAQDDEDLTPLFFNFRSVYRATESLIDGNVKDWHLTVRIKRNGKEEPLIKKGIAKHTILSTHFPIWIHRHVGELQPGKTKSFSAILEDNLELN